LHDRVAVFISIQGIISVGSIYVAFLMERAAAYQDIGRERQNRPQRLASLLKA
jgi:hypothetical protein